MAPTHDTRETERAADLIAARVNDEDASFAEASRRFAAEYGDLLNAVTRLGPRFAFDRDGRPGAIGAVREALPVMERDLFDAIIEDHACEVAAIEEALYQLVRAVARTRGAGFAR
jgi:hypothetical protein